MEDLGMVDNAHHTIDNGEDATCKTCFGSGVLGDGPLESLERCPDCYGNGVDPVEAMMYTLMQTY